MSENIEYKLPREIEKYLAFLSKRYSGSGSEFLQKLVVNSPYELIEGYTYDNWNGGITGHAITLKVPEAIFLELENNDEKSAVEDGICKDLNNLHDIQDEYFDAVSLVLGETDDQDWRDKSGVSIAKQPIIPSSVEKRIWGDGDKFRVFLSHKCEVKKETAEIKEKLALFGVASFVAHEDIDPTKEWQREIENALQSMDAFVVLMTEGFHDSEWTDQEVGFAVCRKVPIIPVRLGKDPYGFIGKIQALSCNWEAAPSEIVKLLLKHDEMKDAYIEAVEKCKNFPDGINLAKVLNSIDKLTEKQVAKLVSAFNNNDQVSGCYGFKGLPKMLSRVTGKNYERFSNGTLDIKKSYSKTW